MYFSKTISRDKINPFLVIGVVGSLILRIINFYIYKIVINDLDFRDTLYMWSGISSTLGLFSYSLITYGVIFYLLKFELLKNEIKRENVFLLLLYSIVSLGFYVPYWFMKKDLKFNTNLSKWIILMVFFLSCSNFVFFNFSGFNDLSLILVILNLLGRIGYLVCFLICIFALRKKVVQRLTGINVNEFWTFLLGALYVQYIINKYIKRHEK